MRKLLLFVTVAIATNSFAQNTEGQKKNTTQKYLRRVSGSTPFRTGTSF